MIASGSRGMLDQLHQSFSLFCELAWILSFRIGLSGWGRLRLSLDGTQQAVLMVDRRVYWLH